MPGTGRVPFLPVDHFADHTALNQFFGWEQGGIIADQENLQFGAFVGSDEYSGRSGCPF